MHSSNAVTAAADVAGMMFIMISVSLKDYHIGATWAFIHVTLNLRGLDFNPIFHCIIAIVTIQVTPVHGYLACGYRLGNDASSPISR